MRLGDGAHEREAEARAVGRAPGAAETLEGDRQEARRKALTLVGDVQVDLLAALGGPQADGARAVAQGIVDEVRHRAVQRGAVAGDRHAAGSVDLDSICWLMSGPIGQLLREHARELRRELPIYFAMPGDEFDANARSTDPQDRVMIRSRIDVLVPAAAGLEIVDYKTDRVPNIDLYRGQMDLYRRAIESMTGQRVAAAHLVFLSARQIVSL